MSLHIFCFTKHCSSVVVSYVNNSFKVWLKASNVEGMVSRLPRLLRIMTGTYYIGRERMECEVNLGKILTQNLKDERSAAFPIVPRQLGNVNNSLKSVF